MLLYSALPYYMVPMTSLMQASYGDVSLMKLFTPYILYIVPYMVLENMKIMFKNFNNIWLKKDRFTTSYSSDDDFDKLSIVNSGSKAGCCYLFQERIDFNLFL